MVVRDIYVSDWQDGGLHTPAACCGVRGEGRVPVSDRLRPWLSCDGCVPSPSAGGSGFVPPAAGSRPLDLVTKVQHCDFPSLDLVTKVQHCDFPSLDLVTKAHHCDFPSLELGTSAHAFFLFFTRSVRTSTRQSRTHIRHASLLYILVKT